MKLHLILHGDENPPSLGGFWWLDGLVMLHRLALHWEESGLHFFATQDSSSRSRTLRTLEASMEPDAVEHIGVEGGTAVPIPNF